MLVEYLEGWLAGRGAKAIDAAVKPGAYGRGSHSSTFQLNVSVIRGIHASTVLFFVSTFCGLICVFEQQ